MNNIHKTNKNFKNVVLHLDTYLRLKTFGHVGDSFNDVVSSLIDEHKSKIKNGRVADSSLLPNTNITITSGDVQTSQWTIMMVVETI